MAWDIGLTRQNKRPPNSPANSSSKAVGRIAQSLLFRQSRLRLAVGYTGVMGTILILLGLGVYQAIAHAHEVTVDRELKSVSDAFHDAIESAAVNSSQLSQLPPGLFPNLCVSNSACTKPIAETTHHHLQSTYQYDYYIRLLSPTGDLLATGGIRPPGLLITSPIPAWQSLKDENNQIYHQIATSLEDDSQEIWAYLLVGRSLQDFDQYLRVVRVYLLIGFVMSLALVAAASWWLSALAMRPIYRSYQQIQQFTTDAAHELRTPLAAIRATVESVLRLPHLSEPEALETLTVIARQNQRLSAMVSDLLLLSRLDNEQQLADKQPCCLQDLLNDIHEEIAALAIAKAITFTLDIQTPLPLIVQGNEEQLYRLVLNLVNNALTYTFAGDQINLELRRVDQRAIISVVDTGIGIAPEHQINIFDRFYRVDQARSQQAKFQQARSQQTGNSGLGLAIALAITKAHQGTLTVTSQLGIGSTFTVSLPFSS